MKSITKLDRLNKCLKLDKPLPIIPLPHGLQNIVGPSIFIGEKYYKIILYPNEITLSTLERLFDKALKDGNHQAVLALLQYATHNKKTFWRCYKGTELGIQIMSEVLGKYDK